MTRKLIPLEKDFLKSTIVPIAIRTTGAKATSLVINRLLQRFPGFSMKVSADHFVPCSPSPIQAIPQSIKTLSEALLWESENRTGALAQIYSSDDIIVLTLNHSICDGGSVVNLFSSLHQDVPGFTSPFFYSYLDFFKKEIENQISLPDPPIPPDPIGLYRSKKFLHTSKLSRTIHFRFPANQISTFNPKTNSFSKNSELAWISLLTAAILHNQKKNWKTNKSRNSALYCN